MFHAGFVEKKYAEKRSTGVGDASISVGYFAPAVRQLFIIRSHDYNLLQLWSMINPPHSGKIKSEIKVCGIKWLRYKDDLVLLKNWILHPDWFQNRTEH